VPRLCELYPGICLTSEGKTRKNLIPVIFVLQYSKCFLLLPCVVQYGTTGAHKLLQEFRSHLNILGTRVVAKQEIILNNQPGTIIIPILFCHKNLHVSDIFSGHHQGFSTVHSGLVSFMQVFDDRCQAESGWKAVPS